MTSSLVIRGDSREVLRTLADSSIDAVVCDPPYALVSIVKRFGKEGAAPAKSDGASGVYARASGGFMGQTWDTGETAFAADFWAEVLRVLKPGGHVLAFGHARTVHRLTCAIEDAGFEIRDLLAWLYGTGFNKKGYIREAGEPVVEGWGGALKPALEPITMGRKPLIGTVAENMRAHGTGALNIDACRTPSSDADRAYIEARIGGFNGTRSIGGNGAYGGGQTFDRAADFDASKGRWPANVLHDGSDAVVQAFPGKGEKNASRFLYCAKPSRTERHIGCTNPGPQFTHGATLRDVETAQEAGDLKGNTHPTVKPIALMRWLCRIVTPPGGTVLDPFCGSGSTGCAAIQEGFSFIGIEREPQYAAIAENRIAAFLPLRTAA